MTSSIAAIASLLSIVSSAALAHPGHPAGAADGHLGEVAIFVAAALIAVVSWRRMVRTGRR